MRSNIAKLALGILILFCCTTREVVGDVLYSNLNPGSNSIFLPGSTGPVTTDASVYVSTLIFVPVSIYGGPRQCNITGITVVGTNDIPGIPPRSESTVIPSDVRHALNVDLYETYINMTMPNSATKIGSWRSSYSATPWPPTYGHSYSGWSPTSLPAPPSLSLWTSDVKQYWMVVSVNLDTSGYIGLLRVVNASASRLCGGSACFTQYSRYIDMRAMFGFSNWTYPTNVYHAVYSDFAPYANTLYLEIEISTNCELPVPPTTPPPVLPPVKPPVSPPVASPVTPISPPQAPPPVVPVSIPVEAPTEALEPIPVPETPLEEPPVEPTPVTAEVPTGDFPFEPTPEDSIYTPDDITPTPVLAIVFAVISAFSLTALIIVMLFFFIYRARVKRIAERSEKTSYDFNNSPGGSPSSSVILSESSPPDRKGSAMMEEPIPLSTKRGPPPPNTIPKPPPSSTTKPKDDESESSSGFGSSTDHSSPPSQDDDDNDDEEEGEEGGSDAEELKNM